MKMYRNNSEVHELHVKFSYFVDQCCEMSLHDPVCLVIMGLVRETTVRIYTVFWTLMYIECIVYKRHNSHLGNCYFRIVK